MAAETGEPGGPGDPRLHELVGAVRSLASARSVDHVAKVVRSAACRLTGADGATFVLRHGDECCYVDEDSMAPLWKGRRFAVSACVSGWAMTHRTPVAIPDIYADDRVPQDTYRSTYVRSMAMVPICSEEPLGAIGTYWASHHEPSAEEIGLLQALADSTAVAMENVHLYDDLEARVEARTAELAAANEGLRRFTTILAHDVRQPLTSISGYAELLRTRYADDLPPDGRAMLLGLHRAARNLANFVMDLQDYASATTMAPMFEPVATEDLVSCVLGRLGHEVETRGAIVKCEGASELIGDRGQLSQALQNLVSNALNYTPEDRTPEIRISVKETPTAWELVVADNGVGVKPEDRERIFEPFERGSGGTRKPGTGLGLALCKRVAEQHGGSIRVEPLPRPGSVFVLVLPRRRLPGY